LPDLRLSPFAVLRKGKVFLMAPFDTKITGLLIDTDDSLFLGPDSAREGKAQSGKKESIDTKEYRKKKKDAHEGKEDKEAKGESDSEDEGHHAADKAEGGEGGHDNNKEGGEKTKGGGGTQSGQGLQSGQTTVQFSSGGGAGNANMASSLASLMGLFSSSAGLARVEGGSALTASAQSASLSSRAASQASSTQASNLFNAELKIKGNVGEVSEQVVESTGSAFKVDTGGSMAAHSSSTGSQDIFSQLINNVSTQAGQGTSDQGSGNTITVTTSVGAGVPIITTFNTGNFFFSSQTPFVFTNSASPYIGMAGTYLQGAGIPTSSSYSYQLASPLASGGSGILTSGITFNTGVPPSALYLDISTPPNPLTAPPPTGLTLTASGDLYANVTSPISVVVDIISGTQSLPVRIDAGPGPLVTTANSSGVMVGSVQNGQFQNTVLSDSVGYTMVGTDTDLSINSSTSPGLISTSGLSFGIPSTGTYSFPSNTLYRHVGTTLQTVPTQAAYGNFDNAPGSGNIYLPNAPSVYTLTMGGNVLDVYGTKYGVANTLDVFLPSNSAPAGGAGGQGNNTLTMGGNTLAGFGTSYGDLQTLTVSAQSGNSATTLGPTDLIFRGNDLAVDKSIDSILYPHLQTLDMQEATSTSSPPSLPANVNMSFQDSLVQGNAGNDTFYGDIQNLSNLTSTTSYGGFLAGVTVTNVNGQVMTTTTDGSNNSIAWGNNVYIGGGGNNTYNFTLLEDAATQGTSPNKAVMQGNALLTDFNLSTDKLNFQISPTLFRALDGADGQGHNKQITVGDLNASVTFSPLSLSTIPNDPLWSQYVSATSTGTTITFDKGVGGGGGGNTNGGSISLLNDTLTGFADIHNLTTNISLLYAPIAALPPNPTVVSTPRATGPFVYGEGAGTLHTGLYYNELDNFFSNSLLATYQISGVASSADSLTPGTPTAIQYDIAPGVIIDQYGTISVDATVTTPTLISLTITGTDQQGATASINQFFGFLNAPITVIADGGTTVGAIGSGANIITGGVGSTLIGESMSSPILTISNSNSTPFIGSNLIVDTAGKATVYGDFQSISFIAQGDSNTHLSNPSNDGNISQPIGQSQPLNFGANAVYAINAAAICGVTPTFDITAQGGLNDDVGSGGLFGGGGGGFSSYSATGNFTNNTFTFGSETIYGSIENVSGVDQSIYGNMQGFNISSIAGSGASLHGGGGSVSLDLSSHVDNNMFTFGPVQIIVQGDVSGQTTNLYPNLKYLSITVEPTSSQSSDGNLTLTTDATFSGNSFVFGNDTLKGGAGKTNFYADIDLTKNTSPYAYNGFISGVTTSTSNGVLTTTTSDNLHNAITWGNNTFIGGTGTNTYNFTLLYNPDGAYASGVDSHGVFTGFDTITNFRPLTDVLTFTVAPNLYKEVLTATGTSSFSAADLNTLATFTNSNGNTIISFNSPSGEGNGSLTLDNVTLTSFAQFSHLVINSANVNATINTGAAFDPVFAKGTSAQSLSAFVNLPPNATATYSATGVTYNSTSVTSGIGVNSNGTIGVSTSLSAPVDATITGIKATITEGGTTTTLNLPDVHVFASNAASVTRDTTSPTISGSPAAAAYEVTADTVYGGGGDIALSSTPLPTYQSKLIDNISTTTHTVYGDVQNITYDGSTTVTGKTFTFKPNLINVNMGTAGADQVFGNAQNLTLSLPSGATTTFSNNTTLNFGSNTIYGSGTLYGDIQTITLNNLSQNANTVIQANFNFGSNTLTGGTYLSYENTVTSSATPTTLYGDVGSLSITGAGAIMSGNIFTFGQNTLTGSQGGSSLYAGVGQLTIENTQAGGQISANHLTFGNSTLTGVGDGLTKFYGDINDLSQTNFYNYDVTATTSSGHVQITDTVGAGTFDSTVLNNIITFGNDTMVGSSTGTSVFNIDLFAATNGSIVGEGNTTITNFGASNANILNLHLSQALYDDILAANGIPSSSTPVPITGAMLDAYYTLNPHDNITQSGGNTLVNFSDGTANNSNFGSITLEGVSVNSFASLGTNLQITADGITTIDPPPSSSNVYHVDVPGADISSATQNTHIVDVSTLGHIVDFGGTLDLGMSNALFKALGLSDANTAAQNLQILQNDANTATGGIAVSTNTTGTGANAVTNTILTFESTTNGVVNTYGSVTLHDTHFNPADPLSAHLQVTHH
jgi:hypothetical protein